MRNGKRILALAIALAITGVAYYMSRGAHPVSQTASPERETAAISDIDLRQLVAWQQFTPKANDEGALTFDFALTRPGYQCTPGDLDGIKADLKRTKTKRLLLSVEPLRPEDSSFKPVVQTLTPQQLFGEKPVRLQLPALKGPMQFGLFLCRDSEGSKRCNNKKAVDINDVLREGAYFEAKGGIPPEPPDRIYFFQYLFLDSEGAVSVFLNAPVAPQYFARLGERFLRLYPAGQAENEVKSLDRAQEIMKTLGPLPLKTMSDKSLVVLLPGRDDKRCPSLAKYLPKEAPLPERYPE